MKRVELLAPVGKMENAISAIENGADALFIGGKLFNARASADNFDNDELKEIVTYAKLRDVKVYVTVNILIKQEEVAELIKYLKYLDEIGVTSIIVQDLGVAYIANKYFPRIMLHASTQLSAHSIEDVMFLKSLGFKRVVLARELSMGEIRKIIDTCDIEVETFVHGALCYSYSGQCLISSLIGGRSGNRGRCAQTCRMRYDLYKDGKKIKDDEYLLSLKDLCLVEFIPELIECGIHSFKVEGRMKSPEYVASVISVYRKYIDMAYSGGKYKLDEADMEKLKAIFNRGGFSKGYYFAKNAPSTESSPRHIGLECGKIVKTNPKNNTSTIMLTRDLHPGDGIEVIRDKKESTGSGISKECKKGQTITVKFDKFTQSGSKVYLTKNHKLLKELKQSYARQTRKQDVDIFVYGKIGENMTVTMSQSSTPENTVTMTGPMLEAAQSSSVTKEQLEKQITKLGSTPFKAANVEVTWDDNVYVNISEINELRRNIAAKLEEIILEVHSSEAEPSQVLQEVMSDEPYEVGYIINDKTSTTSNNMTNTEDSIKENMNRFSVFVSNSEQLDLALEYDEVSDIYVDISFNVNMAIEKVKGAGKMLYVVLPGILKPNIYDKHIKELVNKDIDGFVVKSLGEFNMLKQSGKKLIIDFNLNITNSVSKQLYLSLGAQRVTASVEVMPEEVRALGADTEIVVYGHIPVMTSSSCVLKGKETCNKISKSKTSYLEDRKGVKWGIVTDCKSCVMHLMSNEPLALNNKENLINLKKRLIFTSENCDTMKMVLDYYIKNMPMDKKISKVVFKNVL